MKCETITNKEFEPIKIEITIESIDELKSLYHRFYISAPQVAKASDATQVSKDWRCCDGVNTHSAYKIVSGLCIEHKIKD